MILLGSAMKFVCLMRDPQVIEGMPWKGNGGPQPPPPNLSSDSWINDISNYALPQLLPWYATFTRDPQPLDSTILDWNLWNHKPKENSSLYKWSYKTMKLMHLTVKNIFTTTMCTRQKKEEDVSFYTWWETVNEPLWYKRMIRDWSVWRI